MKKIIITLLIAAIMPAFSQNLLDNSSFETIDEKKNIPASWSVIKRGLIEDTHSFDNTLAKDGKNSAKIENNSGMTKGVTLLYLQSLGQKFNTVPAGTEIELSVYARAISNTARVRVYFESIKGKKLVLRDFEVYEGKWTKFSVKFKKEDVDYGAPYVCLGLLSGNGVIFDCAYLGAAGANQYAALNIVDNLIYNGDFEKVKDSMPISWNIINKTSGKAELVTNGGVIGKNCVKLSSAEKVKGLLIWGHSLDVTNFANIAPGTEIEITLKAKTDKPSTVFRFYTEFMAGRKFIGTYIAHNQKCTKDWEEKKFTFKTPSVTPTGASFYLQLMSPGEVMFDDISMKIKK